MSLGLSMEGTVSGEDGKFSPENNRIVVSAKCSKDFNACASGIVPRNVMTSFSAKIDSTSQRDVPLSTKMFDRICRNGGGVLVAGTLRLTWTIQTRGRGSRRTERLSPVELSKSQMLRSATFGSGACRRPGDMILSSRVATAVRRRRFRKKCVIP